MNKQHLKALLRLALFLAFAVSSVTITALRVVHPSSIQDSSSNMTYTAQSQVRELLLDGVGSQVYFASQGASFQQTQKSVNSLQSFIQNRSGLVIDQDSAARLATLEQNALDTSNRRISCDDLSDSMLAVLTERFRRATDDEIEEAADALSNSKVCRSCPIQSQSKKASDGKPAAGAAPTARPEMVDAITLRANGQGMMSRHEFVESAKKYRELFNAPVQMIAILGVVRPAVRQAFRTRLATLSQALPEQWGDAPTKGLTPVQGFLLAYSVTADDSLFRSNEGLQAKMKWAETIRRQKDPASVVPDGKTAYGSNGYLFSSPVSLIFNKQTTEHFLDKLAERISK